jgi:tetratricopeptide (TPR) repeat protein
MNKKLFFVFVFMVPSVFSQTKQETEDYILKKLVLYGTQSNSHKKIFNLNGSEFVIEYIPSDEYRYEKERYVFPVWAIQSVSLQANGNLIFYLDKYCTSCKKYVNGFKQKYKTEYYTAYEYGWSYERSEYGEQTKKAVEKSRSVKDGFERYDKQENIKSFTIYLKNADPEEDFIGRLQRAIDHLKTMYPKKPSSIDLFDKDKTTYKENTQQTYPKTNYTNQNSEFILKLKTDGAQQFQKGNLNEAKNIFQKVLELSPNDYEAHYNLGVIYTEATSYYLAKFHYQQALKINPNHKNSNWNIANLILEPDNEIYQNMIKLGNTADDKKKYDQLKEERKNIYKQALPYIERLRKIDKNDSTILETLKVTYQILGMTRELIELKN